MSENELSDIRDKIAIHLPIEFFSHSAKWSKSVEDYVFTTCKLIDGRVAKCLTRICSGISEDHAKMIAGDCVKSINSLEQRSRGAST